MMIVRTTEAPRFHLPGLEFVGQASPSRGSAGLCTWRLTLEPGLVSAESHTLDRDEVFMVISGAITVTEDGSLLAAGDVAVVPAGTSIRACNVGDGPAEVVVAVEAGFTATSADGTVMGTPPWAL